MAANPLLADEKALGKEDFGSFADETPSEEIFSRFREIRERKLFFDFRIRVKGKTIRAHKCILATRIPATELLVQYAYTGQIQISTCNAARVLITAGLLGLDSISEFCSDFIVRRLTKDSVFSTLSFALVFQLPAIIEGCMAFMLANFRLLVHSPLLARLDHDTLRSLLCSDDLQVAREEEAFGAVTAWIGCDQLAEASAAPRAKYLPDLLSCLRWSFMSVDFIRDAVYTHPLIHSSIACRDLLDQVIDWFLRPDRVDMRNSPFNHTPRRCWQQDLICVFGSSPTGEAEASTQAATMSSLQIYDPNSGSLSSLLVTVHRTDCLLLPLQGSVHIIGGRIGRLATNTMEVFDLSTKSAISGAAMTTSRQGLFGVATAGELFVFGGINATGTLLDSCEVYNRNKRKWTLLPRMPEARTEGQCASLPDGRLIIAGGLSQGKPLSSVVCFTPTSSTSDDDAAATSTGSWRPIAPMTTPRIRPALMALHGGVLVVDTRGSVEFLRPPSVGDYCSRGQWTSIRLPCSSPLGAQKSQTLSLPQRPVLALGQSGSVYAFDRSSNQVACLLTDEKLSPTAPTMESSDSVQNHYEVADAPVGGLDTETDSDLVARILGKMRGWRYLNPISDAFLLEDVCLIPAQGCRSA
ncbi:Kelch-like protein 12 [Sparganum proliferum]